MRLGLTLCIALATAAAQSALYTDVTDTHLPPDLAGACMAAAAGDIDGDGDLDLALAMEFQPKVLLANDGHGVFADVSAQMPRTVHDNEEVAFADFDGDGDLDLVYVSEDDQQDELFINLIEGRYADASTQLDAGETTSNALAIMDLSNDGVPDLLTGNIGTDLALINYDQGQFSDETFRRWPQHGESRTQDLELADVDGDGDLDVAVGNEGQNELYLNDGSGQLVDVTATHMPIRNDETREIKSADFDADGDLDLVVANVQFSFDWSRQDHLLLNDGSGRFNDATRGRLPTDDRDNFTIQAIDVDRDGDVDIISPATDFDGSGDYQVLLNDGTGFFLTAPSGTVLPASVTGNGFDVIAADFDRDGADDLFLCNRANRTRDSQSAAASGGRQRLLLGHADARD
jgi:hypothetical protein